MVRWPAGAMLGLVFVCLCAARAAAHPLGNFTINHLAGVTLAGHQVRVHYVLDIAEIPAFQIMHAGGDWDAPRMRSWARDEAKLVLDGFSIRANGDALSLQLVDVDATTRPGAGGLPTLYWTGDFAARLPNGQTSFAITDGVYSDRRIGWKDVVLPGASDPTNQLRSYPSALIGSPRRNDRASFLLSSDGRVTNQSVSGSDDGGDWNVSSIVRSSALSDLFSRSDQTPWLVVLTVLAAFGLGALHGLEPGHGKALLAFTLVGARATFKQAGILAVALTLAHTVAVLLLGLALFFAAGFATESLFTWITLISGGAVAMIGARSLAAAIRRASQKAHSHGHADDHGHDHPHDHDHTDDHGHEHAIAGDAPLHFPSAVVAAMSGGIAPCPAAIVVLLTALHLHRIGYGLVLIVVFSLGLAAVLTGLGMAVVRGAAWLQKRSAFGRLSRLAPLFSAGVISIIGATMLAQGFVEQGVRLPALAIVALTLLAIGSFAVIPKHHHRHEGLTTA
jgi:ABC-type nickel/cobalt efflux system permease component RcnA